MSALVFRPVNPTLARVSQRLGIGASLPFSAQGLNGELTLRPLLDGSTGAHRLSWFGSAIGRFALSDAEAMLSLLGELPVTLSGEHQPWYWQLLNQRLSPAIAELLCPLEPLSDITARPIDTDAAMTCRIQLRLGDQSLHGLMSADAEVLLRLLNAPGWELLQHAIDEDWPISQPLELGRLSLTLDQLASLQPGDVLLPSICHFDSDGIGRVHLAGRQWAVQTDSHEQQLYVRLSHEEDLGHGQ